jgi:hypothetical protein
LEYEKLSLVQNRKVAFLFILFDGSLYSIFLLLLIAAAAIIIIIINNNNNNNNNNLLS